MARAALRLDGARRGVAAGASRRRSVNVLRRVASADARGPRRLGRRESASCVYASRGESSASEVTKQLVRCPSCARPRARRASSTARRLHGSADRLPAELALFRTLRGEANPPSTSLNQRKHTRRAPPGNSARARAAHARYVPSGSRCRARARADAKVVARANESPNGRVAPEGTAATRRRSRGVSVDPPRLSAPDRVESPSLSE